MITKDDWAWGMVVQAVVEVYGLSASEVRPVMTFVELGADSLEHVELIMALEEVASLKIPDSVFGEVLTLGDLAEWVRRGGG